MYFIVQMTKVHFSYLFGFIHGSWPTAPKTLRISWVISAMGASFVNIWSPVLSSRNPFKAIKAKWVPCYIHNKPFSITTKIMLMRWLLESTKRWGLPGEPTMWLEVDLVKKKSLEGEVGHEHMIKRFTPTWKSIVLRVGLCWKPCGWRSKARGTEVILL